MRTPRRAGSAISAMRSLSNACIDSDEPTPHAVRTARTARSATGTAQNQRTLNDLLSPARPNSIFQQESGNRASRAMKSVNWIFTSEK